MESPSPLSRYTPQNSKKRVFPWGSSMCMEAEVVEISPPPPSNRSSKSKSLKQKEVIFPEIIDVDLDEDCGDVMLIDEKVVPIGKGKEVMDKILSDRGDGTREGSVDDALLSKNCTTGTANIINVDDFGSNSFYGDDKYLDMYYDDITYDDEYAIFLQSHFDSLDMPPGIEAPIPWLSGHNANKMKSSPATTSNNSLSKSKPDNVGFPSGLDSSLSSWPLESAQIMSTPGSSSTSGTPFSSLGQTESSTWSFPKPAQGKRNLTAASGFTYSNSQLKDPVNLPSGEKLPKPFHFHSSSHLEKEPFSVGATSYISSETDFLIGASYTPTSKQHDNLWSNVATSMTAWQGIPSVAGHANGSSWVSQGSNGSSEAVHVFPKETAFNPLFNIPALAPSAAATSEISSLSTSTKVEYGNSDEIMKRFQLFKNFDTVQDFSDHYYYQQGSSVKQPSKNWTKKIQEEWRILEKDLPDTIFVRVYESRMDLLRAVIMGAEGTPYHDGLFFFDVFFPSNYPNVPPKVHYHSGGLRINPNLYNCGKVCLSLLNTWSGSQKEKWIPRTSTMLQVLVSIQGLILNTKPYFNEPGYASMSGSINGEKNSLQYNESTFILSLKTMVYNIRRPPKYFEDFVAGHFCKRAHDILVACRAYIDGAQVGCLVKGGVQDVDEGDKSCSQAFRDDVASFINTLVHALKQVGAKDCEKFLPLAQKASGLRPVVPSPAYF